MITVIALILVTIGALNWLAVGIFDFNVVNWMFTPNAYVGARIVYAYGLSHTLSTTSFLPSVSTQ